MTARYSESPLFRRSQRVRVRVLVRNRVRIGDWTVGIAVFRIAGINRDVSGVHHRRIIYHQSSALHAM